MPLAPITQPGIVLNCLWAGAMDYKPTFPFSFQVSKADCGLHTSVQTITNGLHGSMKIVRVAGYGRFEGCVGFGIIQNTTSDISTRQVCSLRTGMVTIAWAAGVDNAYGGIDGT